MSRFGMHVLCLKDKHVPCNLSYERESCATLLECISTQGALHKHLCGKSYTVYVTVRIKVDITMNVYHGRQSINY